MNWYCEKCKKLHEENELCPHIKAQLAEHPEWITGAANFTTVAGAERLITTQTLDHVAQGVNKLVGTNLSYEGTHQYARDIQVFKRLHTETYARSGVFSTPEAAKAYFENALNKPEILTNLESKFTGAAQEVDWLRVKNGQLSSLVHKSSLLNDNAPGLDGVTVNRFTGKTISRTTIKASKNPMNPSSTGIKQVQQAIEKGTATEQDIIFAPKGASEAARSAGLSNPVQEMNTAEQIREANERLKEKIMKGQVATAPTARAVAQKMAQGAVVGAAVAVTISGITSYVRYKNGELTREEAFRNIAEETLKGALVGGAMGAVTIFLPAGVVGFIAGMAIGVYINKVCANILDEIYGKGAYGAILNASGYVYGMTFNLAAYYEKIEEKRATTAQNIREATAVREQIKNNFETFERMKGE